MKKNYIHIIAFATVLVTMISSICPIAYAVDSRASVRDGIFDGNVISQWMSRSDQYGEFGSSGKVGIWGGDGDGGWYVSNRPQKYYTTPTSSVEDKYGNVTNYYRSGDTTSTKIIDSYNHTFNTIHNTTNNTNNYSANVKLSDFLNTYSTVNNDYTYNSTYNSWYYDNTKNILNYTDQDTFYSYDNRQYFVSIDNSTDEYYLIDVQYSPTFVTVNYNYYNTNNTTNNVGDVTNIYYFELADGRNSSTLSASEVAGLDLGYDVANYVLVPDDPNTLSLQHFDGSYTDSSSYGRDFYSENRSTNYVDSGAFGQAVKISNGSAAGITIPGLSDYGSLSFDFRIYYADIADLGIYIGDTNIFQEVPTLRKWVGQDVYSDDGEKILPVGGVQPFVYYTISSNNPFSVGSTYDYSYIGDVSESSLPSLSTSFDSNMDIPTSYSSPNYSVESNQKYGWFFEAGSPVLHSSNTIEKGFCTATKRVINNRYYAQFTLQHYVEKEYRWSPSQYVIADFNYDAYKTQWVSMRIVISGGKLYYFVNGDLVGSGAFTMPSADKFYIKSSGTLYLDELRVTTGDMVSTGSYTPSSEPFDTNKVLALPNELIANTIYVRHSTPVNGWRIGGVRPSNPATGFFYLPLHADYTGGQSQLYDGSNWVDVEAMVYDGSEIHSVIGYTFTPVSESPDVDSDLEPGRPPDPGEDVDQSTCTHTWEVTGGVKSTCTLNGTVEYTCSKCKATKSESIPKLGHTWEVKTSIQTTYDEQGNVVTQGYTIYRCTVCGEEFKDTEGTGPPQSNPSTDEGGEKQGFLGWLGSKVGELFGAIGDGVIGLLKSALGKVLDGLISLVNMVFDKLKTIVDLFGGFGDALGVLWTWLPPEIVTVLVAAVTVFVFIALLKLFMK